MDVNVHFTCIPCMCSCSNTHTDHACEYSGCRNVLVIDGNMKNHRDTCKAVDAGYIQFDGLPGLFKTGCTRTPAYMNRFCYDHAPRVCQVRTLTEDSLSEEGVVDLVIGKKTLRNVTYYKVYSSYRLLTMANAILYV